MRVSRSGDGSKYFVTLILTESGSHEPGKCMSMETAGSGVGIVPTSAAKIHHWKTDPAQATNSAFLGDMVIEVMACELCA